MIIIGAGPAGSAAAITSAQSNLDVLLVDAKKFPRRKACGGCLNKISVSLVKQLLNNADFEQLWKDSIPVKKFQVFHHHRSFPLKMDNGGCAVDRSQLDLMLVRQARQMGVHFLSPASAKLSACHPDHRCVDITYDGRAETYMAKAVVIASGLSNRVASSYPEFQQTPAQNSRLGVEAIFESFPDDYRSGELNMAVGDSGYVGLTHIGDGRLHVAAAVDRSMLQRLGPQATVDNLIRQSGAPPLRQTDATWKGTPALTAAARCIADDRVFLIGDAAGYVEPFTGEGIRWALESGIGVAPFIASTVENWDQRIAKEHQRWYRQTIRARQKLCRRISAGLKRPTVRWAAHQALRLRPSLADLIIKRLNS